MPDLAVESPALWPDTRVHVVSGKGGTGKTTVAAAWAVALASQGKRVLVAEVEGRQGISQTFDVPPLPATEVHICSASGGGEVVGLAVDAKTALLEYLQLFYHLGRAGGVLERFGAIDFATTIAPGVRDVLTFGRLYEANRRRKDDKHHRGSDPADLAFDAIVLDAPPTGRIVRYLSVNAEVAGLARMGPIRNQATSIVELLTSPATMVHLVTLLEEMPVQETVDAVGDLAEAGLHVGAVIINQVREPVLEPSALAQVQAGLVDRERIRADLVDAGLPGSADVVEGLIRQGSDHAERVALEREQLETLSALEHPLLQLPALPDGVDPDAVRQLAGLLAGQGIS